MKILFYVSLILLTREENEWTDSPLQETYEMKKLSCLK